MKKQFNIPVSLLFALLAGGALPAAAQSAAPAAAAAATSDASKAAAGTPLEMKEAAPTRYTVVKGDTLWGISARYLKNPWRWNELWRMNKDQVKNPHWIYPGNVLVLGTGADGTPQLRVAEKEEERPTVRVPVEPRVSPLENQAIPAIPPAIIDPFLTRPILIEQGGLERAPRVIGGPDQRVVFGAGLQVYVTGLNPADGVNWQVYRPGRALVSPRTNETLGYEAEYLGDALVQKAGEVSTVLLQTSRREVVAGDRLVPVPKERIINYPPHAPERAVDGRIIGLPTSLIESGRDAVVTLDVGAKDGLEIGHVVALYHQPPAVNVETGVKSRILGIPETRPVTMPEERIGLAFVFRVFDRVSYALVLNSTKQIELGDSVHKP